MYASMYFTRDIHFFVDPFVVVVVDIFLDTLRKGLKEKEVLLKAIVHFFLHPAKERLHNAVIVAIVLSGHGLPRTVFC